MAAQTDTRTKQRIADHGEVFTRPREVNAMLDLVKQETERLDSRFLEPACGTGNFLAEVLDRKLKILEGRYKKSQVEFERHGVITVGSLYGIDILADNIEACRQRLYQIFDDYYSGWFQRKAKADYRAVIRYILERNIIHGDALTLKTVSEPPQPITFSEWSMAMGSQIKRRDFAFHELIPEQKPEVLPLFAPQSVTLKSDTGEPVFIPEPIREFPLTHYLRLSDVAN